MILFNTLDYDPTKEVVKFMDGKLRSKEAFVASGFGVSFVDGRFKRLNIYQPNSWEPKQRKSHLEKPQNAIILKCWWSYHKTYLVNDEIYPTPYVRLN